MIGKTLLGKAGSWCGGAAGAGRRHCQELGLTHFVDDHPEVHAAICGTVDYQYFFGPQRAPVPGYGNHAASWAEVDGLIRASLDTSNHH
jgi:hypothetical protein